MEISGPVEFTDARVVRGHGHDCARAVAGENVIGDPNRDILPVHGIDGESACEHSGLALRFVSAFAIRFAGDFFLVGRYGSAL